MSVKILTDADFEQKVIKTKKTVLIDFWAEWCEPCRQLSPVIEEIEIDMGGTIDFYKMDVDSNPVSASRFAIMSIPTLLIFKEGEISANMVGAGSKTKIIQWINDNSD